MLSDYAAWLNSHRRMPQVASLLKVKPHDISLEKIIGSWYISYLNQSGDEDRIKEKLFNDLKGFKLREDSSFDVSSIWEVVNLLHAPLEPVEEPKEPASMLTEIVSYGEFYFNITPYPDFVKKAKLSQTDLESVVNMLMRYSTYMYEGYHWKMPLKLEKYLQTEYQVDTELFASPFNKFYPNYYSIYEEDQDFGSRGNFFTVSSLEGNFTCNPPYVEDVMNKMAIKLQQLLLTAHKDGREVRFFSMLPKWEDADYYQLLMKSPFLSYKGVLQGKKHFYETATGDKIVAKWESILVVLDSTKMKGDYRKCLSFFEKKQR